MLNHRFDSKRHGVEINWECGNVSEMRTAARWLRQKAYELEKEIEHYGESKDTVVKPRLPDVQENLREASKRKRR